MTVSISSITGTVSNNQQITIAGSGFGVNGPTIVIFDDFEGGTDGEALALNLAEIGQWTARYAEYTSAAMYCNDLSISGSLSAHFDCDYASQNPAMIANHSDVFDSFFVSYWVIIPAGDNWPGEGPIQNWKLTWISKSIGWTDADVCCPTAYYPTDPRIEGNDWPGSNVSLTKDMAKGVWMRYGIWIKGREDATGEVKGWQTDSAGTIYSSALNRITLGSGDSDKRIRMALNGFVREDTNSHPHFDDIYWAVGEYAQARVEIGNNATYANCTNMTLATVDSWSATSIQATVRQGSFQGGNTGYVFVWDADGLVNASGFPVTFGEGSASVSPSGTPSPTPSSTLSPSSSKSHSKSSSKSASKSRSRSSSKSSSKSSSRSKSMSQSQSSSPSPSPSGGYDYPRFVVHSSTNITDGEATTHQLIPPGAKQYEDFQAGKIHDVENPANPIDLDSDKYTEIEYCLQATEYAEVDETYEFRVVKGE